MRLKAHLVSRTLENIGGQKARAELSFVILEEALQTVDLEPGEYILWIEPMGTVPIDAERGQLEGGPLMIEGETA